MPLASRARLPAHVHGPRTMRIRSARRPKCSRQVRRGQARHASLQRTPQSAARDVARRRHRQVRRARGPHRRARNQAARARGSHFARRIRRAGSCLRARHAVARFEHGVVIHDRAIHAAGNGMRTSVRALRARSPSSIGLRCRHARCRSQASPSSAKDTRPVARHIEQRVRATIAATHSGRAAYSRADGSLGELDWNDGNAAPHATR